MKFVLIGVSAFLVASAALVGGMIMVMAIGMGMGGHMAMMGGQGSNPDEETPVQGVTQVRIRDFAFQPANIVIDAGQTVTWTNEDSLGHTVTSDEGDTLGSEILGEGESFRFTFTQPGQYRYHCTPHPNMKGLVTARAASGGEGRSEP